MFSDCALHFNYFFACIPISFCLPSLLFAACEDKGCSVNAHCRTDSLGDLLCICNDGFVGNGVVCAGKDESDQCLEITSFSLLEALLCSLKPLFGGTLV